MSVQEIRRDPIDPAQRRWKFLITGDPSVSPGFSAGVGSFAQRMDGTLPGDTYVKTDDTVDTAWTQILWAAGKPIAATDLPDLSALIDARVMDLITNPLAQGTGITPLADQRFALLAQLSGSGPTL